jgi:hypothetical protein
MSSLVAAWESARAFPPVMSEMINRAVFLGPRHVYLSSETHLKADGRC